jgi:hypothetical protein
VRVGLVRERDVGDARDGQLRHALDSQAVPRSTGIAADASFDAERGDSDRILGGQRRKGRRVKRVEETGGG